MSKNFRGHPYLTVARRVGRRMPMVRPSGKTINTYLPVELMEGIFRYSIESNYMKPGQLASVCRYWRSVITSMSERVRSRIARRRMLLVPPRGNTINTYLPMELMEEILLYCVESNRMKSGQLAPVCRYWRSVVTTMSEMVRGRIARRRMLLVPPYGNTINTYLPIELMKEIFLYGIESNYMKSGQLASVCRYWRSVITTISHLWSTLKLGTWTETVQVTTWLQRAYPKKVIIDTERDVERSSSTQPFAALQDALVSTGQWRELVFFSFPPDNFASRLVVRVGGQMKMLKILHVAAGCVQSPLLAHLLNLIPTDAPLSELRLHASFATTKFLQPHWFPVLQNLTVLIVSGKDIDEPFKLLPTFTQLQIFEADRLRLPFYELDTNLPLLSTLQKLQLRACSVQWMAGRHFPCLEECVILLPRHWGTIQLQNGVRLSSCKKLTYHGHPMTTAQYFHVPEMREMDLRSHDCNGKRVYRQLRHLCTLDGWISKLTTLHLALQCSEQAVINVIRYLGLLQELTLSIVHPSSSWQSFLESLAAIPDANGWLDQELRARDHYERWKWCSSRTWHVNSLPNLKYLGIQCPKGFSRFECLDNCALLRLVGWTRAQLKPPLEQLKVWEGSGITEDIVVNYISAGYLEKHLGTSVEKYDQIVVGGMITKLLFIDCDAIPVFRLHSTILFRQLQELVVRLSHSTQHDIPILPYLEQIKRLEIWGGIIPPYPLEIDLPLTRTLQWFKLKFSTSFWMIGRSFKALREFDFYQQIFYEFPEEYYRRLPVNLPVCTTLKWRESMTVLRLLSCPNVQNFHFRQGPRRSLGVDAPQFLTNVLFKFLCLKQLDIRLSEDVWWANSLLQFVLWETRERGVWRDIRSVDVTFGGTSSLADAFFSEAVRDRQHYEKWWKKVTVTKENANLITINASI